MLFRQVLKTFHCLKQNPPWDLKVKKSSLVHITYQLVFFHSFNQLGIWNQYTTPQGQWRKKFTPLHSPICHSTSVLMHHKHIPNPPHLLALGITSSQHFPFLIYNWNKKKNLMTASRKYWTIHFRTVFLFVTTFGHLEIYLKIYILSLCHIWLQLAILW